MPATERIHALTEGAESVSAPESFTSAPETQSPASEPQGTRTVRDIDIGTVLANRYLIERAVGSGGMSTVFSALDRHRLQGPAADAKVAVKVLDRALLNDKARVQRLIREFRYMQRLTHRGILRVFDLDCDEGTWFITMELLHGQPLSHYLQRHQPGGLPPDEALRILIECTEALVCAHDNEVIHGDLKPGNIFIDTRGAARLLDFGSVPEKSEDADAARDRFLTPAYASPQMLESQPADLRDDLFSLGCIAYELFSGRHPFGLVSSVAARRQKMKLTWTPSIPACHFGVIARMLSWDRRERPANGREFLESLMAAQVRARAAFTREPRPAVPDEARATTAQAPKPEATNHTRETERERTVHRRDAHRSAAPEDLARAFAKFSGVVPDDWVGHDESPAPATPDATVAAPAVDSSVSVETAQPKPAEPAKERWSKAIPPEWLEPMAKVVDTPPPAPAPESASPVDDEQEEQAPEPVGRAVPWLSQLRWNNASVLNRIRQSSRSSAAEAKASAPPPVVAAAENASEPVAGEPPPAPKQAAPWRMPQLNWRTSTPATWSTLAMRLRTLRMRSAAHADASALETRTAGSAVSSRAVVPGWTPQLQWRKAMTIPWRDVQAPAFGLVTTTVHVGTPLPEPALGVPASSPPIQPAPQPTVAAAPVAKPARPPVDWGKAVARTMAFATLSAQKLRAAIPRPRRRELNLMQHWVRLRQSIGTLAIPRPERPTLTEWLTQRAPRWREAVPAVSIVGIAVLSLGLLQISDASRFATNLSAERTRLAALRLQELANAPIEMNVPVLASLSVPVAPVPAQPVVPRAPGSISFQSTHVRVSAGQQMAVVNLLRNNSTSGSAPFGWRIAPGTARPGVDYELPKIQSARFNDGQDVRSLYIPVKPAKSGARPERRFTIKLTQTPGGPAFGRITETEVVLEGTG